MLAEKAVVSNMKPVSKPKEQVFELQGLISSEQFGTWVSQWSWVPVCCLGASVDLGSCAWDGPPGRIVEALGDD